MDKEEKAKGLAAIMLMAVPVVVISLSIAIGIAFGAAWGFASFAAMVVACFGLLVWAAKRW